ncbi:MAG: ABC transporter ATP-binding protein/permease, partial [Acidiferrobacterales bacterium]
MRPSQYAQSPISERPWTALATLLPYLWEFRGRVLIALAFLILAKLASIGIPLIIKEIVDALDKPNALLTLPIFFLIAYGALRLANALFGELRDAVFAKVTQRSIRRVALQVFQHLHKLALRFHLDRQTGGISRDIERGTAGIGFLLNFTVFNILPTLLEIGLVVGILLAKLDAWFAIITFFTLSIYILFTFFVTEWRMKFRRAMNEMDSKANTVAIDSLLNYETVKYFNNEDYEARRYDDNLRSWESAAIRTQTSLAALNTGQGAIIATGVTLLMVLASQGVVGGTMTLGDLVMVNAFLIQLYMPMRFLGTVYREIRHALADMEKMFGLLGKRLEVEDKPNAKDLVVQQGHIRFEHVAFGYDPDRQILFDVDFAIPAQ